MIRIFLTLLIVILTGGVFSQTSTRINMQEDATLNFTEIANKYGYKTEEYDVMSEGYYLKTIRIPGDRNRPVLLVHGLLGSSDGFIMRGNTSLAIALARQNFDVWAMNYRGNRYSRRHIQMDPDSDKAFWNFSLHEIGYYDVPANIDFILNKTGKRTLGVIGFSEGTAAMFVLGATRPDYNRKVNIFIAMAPICYLHNIRSHLSYLIKLAPVINVGFAITRHEEILGYNSPLKKIIHNLCRKDDVGYNTCLIKGLFPVTGTHLEEIEPEFLPVILGHTPAGTSRKNLHHLSQISRRRKFANYNYGIFKNMAIYGRISPPEYDLSRVTMKVALLVARNDKMSTIKDVALLRRRLPNVVEYIMMKDSAFNHIDYIWGKNTHITMFPDLIGILNKYDYVFF